MHNFIVILTLITNVGQFYSVDVAFEQLPRKDSYVEGKKQYENFSSKMTTYGSCWKTAILDLHTGCRQLTEETQSRLALNFANCFLQKAGSKICKCPPTTSISECLKNADERIFSTFREFFTHTQNICYFLQHELWQEQTETTISKLATTSEKVSIQMDKSQKSQSSILQLQRISVKKQQQLINSSENGLKQLNEDLQKSRNTVKNVFDEFKTITTEHRMLIFNIFDHIKKLENLIVGEFSGVYTIIYYLLAVILSYMLTSTPRTANARIWLLLLVTCNALLERLIVIYSIEEETSKVILLDQNGPIYQRVWLCRKAVSVVGCIILVASSYLYKDYNIINNQLLLDIQEQNLDMQKFIRQISTSPKSLINKSVKDNNNVKDIVHVNNVVSKCSQPNVVLDTVLKHEEIDKKTRREMKKVYRKIFIEKGANDKDILEDNNSTPKDSRYNLRDRSRLSSPFKNDSSSLELQNSILTEYRISSENQKALKKRSKSSMNKY